MYNAGTEFAGVRKAEKEERERTMVLRKVGKYEIGRTIGEGTFAKVKFAQNTETGGSVAMKVLDRSTIIKHKMVDQVSVKFPISPACDDPLC